MLKQPVIFSQLITVFAVVTWMVRLALPPWTASVPPGHWLGNGPVLPGPGHPHAARWDQTYAPPLPQAAGGTLAWGVDWVSGTFDPGADVVLVAGGVEGRA